MISDVAIDLHKLILDGTKIQWHQERIAAWLRGEKIAPITIDMALTRACNYACGFCYATLQENERKTLTKEIIENFMDDAAEVGVKGISLVSDGESTLSPFFEDAIIRGSNNGISMAVGTNGYLLDEPRLRRILPHLTYLRINFSAGEEARYRTIMGTKPGAFEKVCENIKSAVRIKNELGLNTTIGMQMVFDPRYVDQVLPLAKLGKELRPDYLVLKHISDSEDGALGVDYSKYPATFDTLRAAEALSDDTYRVAVKWNKIKTGDKRTYSRCYGARFLMQLSGSGLVAPCGMSFNKRYEKLHIGNIATQRFKDIVYSDRFQEVMDYLASEDFDAKKMCGSLCLQDLPNRYLDALVQGKISAKQPDGALPDHVNFI